MSRSTSIYRRSSDSEFLRELAIGLDAIFDLPEIGVKLSLADLHEGIDFDAEADALRL